MKNTTSIVIFALFTYLFISPFFFHPDLKIIYHHAQFLTSGVFNIYSFLNSHPEHATLGQFVYPPLAYLVFGLLTSIAKIFSGPEFISWLAQGNTAVSTPYIFRYLFMLKRPLVLIHIFTGLLIGRLFTKEEEKKWSMAIWFFNPISIYVVAVIGQFDIIPVFLTVLSLVLFPKKPFLAAICLGLGGSLKTYPLLLLPFLSVAAFPGWPKRILVAVVGLMPYLLFTLPFIKDPNFINNVLVSGLSQRLFHASLPIGFDKSILIIPGLIFVLLFFFINKKDKRDLLPGVFGAVLLICLAGSHFHPQWVLWAMPFVTIYLTKTRNLWPLVVLCMAWFGVLLLFPDNFLTWGVISPLEPQSFSLPPIASILPPTLPWQNIAQTLFAAIALWLAYKGVTDHE